MSDNPQFWIDVVRTQAHVTDCREKTLALTNASEAFARIFEDQRKRDESARLLVEALLTDKHELQSDISASRAECERYRAALRSICSVAVTRESSRYEVEKIAHAALEAKNV